MPNGSAWDSQKALGTQMPQGMQGTRSARRDTASGGMASEVGDSQVSTPKKWDAAVSSPDSASFSVGAGSLETKHRPMIGMNFTNYNRRLLVGWKASLDCLSQSGIEDSRGDDAMHSTIPAVRFVNLLRRSAAFWNPLPVGLRFRVSQLD